MAKQLDFNALKKQYLTVTLSDENKTKLLITMPTKKALDSFLNMKDSLSAETIGDKAIDELYEIIAELMSHNKGGIKISKKTIEEIFDYEDIIVFVRAYTDFINEVVNSKNF